MSAVPAEDGLTLRIERLLDAPRETVWRHLVDPELRRSWFAGGSEGRGEGALTLVFDHDNLSAEPSPYPPEYARFQGASAHETIVEHDPPRVLAFTWGGGSEGIARFELFEEGARTRLVLEHRGITGPAPRANFGAGWTSHLAVLAGLFSGAPVRDFWALHRASERAFRDDG